MHQRKIEHNAVCLLIEMHFDAASDQYFVQVHWICPQQIDDAIASGLTTMYGGGSEEALLHRLDQTGINDP